VLRACREVLKPGGRLAFYTIYIPPGLPPDVYERAKGAAPGAAGSRQGHQSMLASAGFKEIHEIDVTPQYLATIRARSTSRGRRRGVRAPRHRKRERSRGSRRRPSAPIVVSGAPTALTSTGARNDRRDGSTKCGPPGLGGTLEGLHFPLSLVEFMKRAAKSEAFDEADSGHQA